MKFDIWGFFENLLRKFNFHKNRTKITVSLLEDHYTFLIPSRSFLLRIGNVSDEICRENRNIHFVLSNFSFSQIVPLMR
jgi:hypothetical protein